MPPSDVSVYSSLFKLIVCILEQRKWRHHIFMYLNEINELTVKLFNFMDTKVCGLMTMIMFMDTFIRGFQIISKKLKWVNNLKGS